MRVTLVQFAPKLSKINLDEICNIVNTHKKESDLIVFGELSLNGYLLQDKLSEDAWDIEMLDEVKKLSVDVDIVVGAALRDGKNFKNSAIYFNDGRVLSIHDKVYLPNYGMFEEARYFRAGDVFESFESKFGKTSMVICEDLWHKDVHHDLIAENPDIIIALVASPARGFYDGGLEIRDKWYDIVKVVSKECNAKLIFVNRVGFEDGLGFWGGSCIAESGEILEKFELFNRVIKTIEV